MYFFSFPCSLEYVIYRGVAISGEHFTGYTQIYWQGKPDVYQFRNTKRQNSVKGGNSSQSVRCFYRFETKITLSIPVQHFKMKMILYEPPHFRFALRFDESYVFVITMGDANVHIIQLLYSFITELYVYTTLTDHLSGWTSWRKRKTEHELLICQRAKFCFYCTNCTIQYFDQMPGRCVSCK